MRPRMPGLSSIRPLLDGIVGGFRAACRATSGRFDGYPVIFLVTGVASSRSAQENLRVQAFKTKRSSGMILRELAFLFQVGTIPGSARRLRAWPQPR